MGMKKKKTSFWDHKQGCMNVGSLFVQTCKELSTIPAHAARELTGQPHNKKIKGTLKKGWFE